MSNTNKLNRLFTRRALMLGGGQLALSTILLGRLYHLQVIKSEEYKTFSDSNRIKILLLPPVRGKILDRRGDPFALNENHYRLVLDPEVLPNGSAEAVLTKLSRFMNDGVLLLPFFIKKWQQHRSRRPLMLYEKLSWEEVCRIELHNQELPGLSIDVGHIRQFPLGALSPHPIGYLGPVTEAEITKNPLLNHPDFKVGKEGIEESFETALRGKVGIKRMEVNAHGLTVRELERQDSVPGEEVRLTLDARLQNTACQRIQGEAASVVVVDIKNGDILCMASSPGFNPAEFTYGVSPKYWNRLLKDPMRPLMNKAISGQYPPGSTFKLVVVQALQKAGIHPAERVSCPGFYMLGNHRFNCWRKEGHGSVDMRGALMHSCDVYFYTMAKRIGPDAIGTMARLFGLGERLGLPLRGEKPGLVPSEEWKKKRYKSAWLTGETLNIGIGQGYLLSTPLQLSVMVARIASGKKVMPSLIAPPEPVSFPSLGLPEEHLQVARDGMFQVMNVPGGTAYRSRIEDPQFTIGGKTGTSQVISKKGLEAAKAGGLTPAEQRALQNHALFVAYGPFENPRYAVCVVVEHGIGGAAAAAPVGHDVLLAAHEMDVLGLRS